MYRGMERCALYIAGNGMWMCRLPGWILYQPSCYFSLEMEVVVGFHHPSNSHQKWVKTVPCDCLMLIYFYLSPHFKIRPLWTFLLFLPRKGVGFHYPSKSHQKWELFCVILCSWSISILLHISRTNPLWTFYLFLPRNRGSLLDFTIHPILIRNESKLFRVIIWRWSISILLHISRMYPLSTFLLSLPRNGGSLLEFTILLSEMMEQEWDRSASDNHMETVLIFFWQELDE